MILLPRRGSPVQIEFTLIPVVISSKNVQRVTIRVGQEVFEMDHGLHKKTLVWQASGDKGTPIEIAFDPLPGAGDPAKTVVEGTWSLLRWLTPRILDKFSRGVASRLTSLPMVTGLR